MLNLKDFKLQISSTFSMSQISKRILDNLLNSARFWEKVHGKFSFSLGADGPLGLWRVSFKVKAHENLAS